MQGVLEQLKIQAVRVVLPVPPKTYDACVGLCQTGRWGAVKECWNDGKSKPLRWYYWPLPMRYFKWDRQGAYLGRRRKVQDDRSSIT